MNYAVGAYVVVWRVGKQHKARVHQEHGMVGDFTFRACSTVDLRHMGNMYHLPETESRSGISDKNIA